MSTDRSSTEKNTNSKTIKMEQKALKTRFEEFIIPTSDPKEMVGKYLAADAKREWTEDFLDETTGEVVQVTRYELILKKGEFLSAENIASLSFCLQTGDLKSVSVSNIKRSGDCIEVGKDTIWSVAVVGGGNTKKRKYILFAQCLDQALKIARDYLEQTLEGSFNIVAAKSYQSCIIIPEDSLKKVVKDSEGNIVENESAAVQSPEFYSIHSAIKTKEGTRDYIWLLMATSVDDAKTRIHKYVDAQIQKKVESGESDGESWEGYEITILSGAGVSVNSVIPREFSEAYFQWEEAEKIAHDPDKLLKAFEKSLSK